MFFLTPGWNFCFSSTPGEGSGFLLAPSPSPLLLTPGIRYFRAILKLLTLLTPRSIKQNKFLTTTELFTGNLILGTQRHFYGFVENSWTSSTINENPRKSKKIRENQTKSKKIYEYLRKSMKTMKIKQNQWKSTKINENPWKS